MDVAITFYLQYGLSEICYQLKVCLMSFFYKKLFARQKNKITIEISKCNRWLAELAICIDDDFRDAFQKVADFRTDLLCSIPYILPHTSAMVVQNPPVHPLYIFPHTQGFVKTVCSINQRQI